MTNRSQINIYIETNENENMTTQNLKNSVKAVLRGRFMTIKSYFKKQEKHQITNLTIHLKQLENEVKKNPEFVEGKKQ